MGIERRQAGAADRLKMVALRGLLKLAPATTFDPDARPAFDKTMADLSPADGIVFEPEVVGGVPGWWCHPVDRSGVVILYLHGGAYGIGAAWAYRPFVSQIVSRTGASAFVADYGLAPERPFPGAFADAEAVWRSLSERHDRVALIGDSAGGGLALALACHLAGEATAPRCLVAMSPWCDLSLSGGSIGSRIDRDPLLTREVLSAAVERYLGGRPSDDPKASPLFAEVDGLPPIELHVGDDELLLDDTVRMVAKIEDAGNIVRGRVWEEMIHVFPSLYGSLRASRDALDEIGGFVRSHTGSR